jgi:ATP-dependent Zn protease
MNTDHDAGVLGYVKRAAAIGTAIDASEPNNYLRLVTESVTLLLAGVAAEQEHARKRHNWPGATSDLRGATDLAARIAGRDELPAYMKWLTVRTRNMVKRRWAAIDALARELLVREEMSGADATALIRRTSSPPMLPEDIARLAAQFATVATR